MGKLDLKVTVGLLVLGVGIGMIALKVSGLTTHRAQEITRRDATVVPPVAPTPGAHSVRGRAAPSREARGASSGQEAPGPKPTAPPSGAIREPLYAVKGKILTVDPDQREIELEIVVPTGGSSPEEIPAQPTGERTVKKLIYLSDATRIEHLVAGKGHLGEPPTTARHRLGLEDLRSGDFVQCTYRTETSEELQGVETISRLVEMDIDAYVNSDAYKAWLAKQPAYVKGRVVSVDLATRTIGYKGYAFDRVPRNAPTTTVMLTPGARVLQIDDEMQLTQAKQSLALSQLRVGQTVFFPVDRQQIEGGMKSVHIDTMIAIVEGGHGR